MSDTRVYNLAVSPQLVVLGSVARPRGVRAPWGGLVVFGAGLDEFEGLPPLWHRRFNGCHVCLLTRREWGRTPTHGNKGGTVPTWLACTGRPLQAWDRYCWEALARG